MNQADQDTLRRRNLITAVVLTLFFVTLIIIAISSSINPG